MNRLRPIALLLALLALLTGCTRTAPETLSRSAAICAMAIAELPAPDSDESVEALALRCETAYQSACEAQKALPVPYDAGLERLHASCVEYYESATIAFSLLAQQNRYQKQLLSAYAKAEGWIGKEYAWVQEYESENCARALEALQESVEIIKPPSLWKEQHAAENEALEKLVLVARAFENAVAREDELRVNATQTALRLQLTLAAERYAEYTEAYGEASERLRDTLERAKAQGEALAHTIEGYGQR